ncbi:MAG: sulfatase family protein [Solirubrobacterales bacterium]
MKPNLPMTLFKSPHATLRALVGTLAVACALLAAAAAIPARAAAAPNVVVIQTDDMTRLDLYSTYADPVTGLPIAVMPNTLNLIASQGVTFNRYYVSNPLCCPSRASMLTGRYSHNNGVLTNFFPSGGYYKFDNQNSLASWLRTTGYQTSHVGKFMNQYGDNNPTEVPPGWTDWHTVIGDARLFYGYENNDNGTVSEPHGGFDETTTSYMEKDSPSCPDNPPPLQECNYLTDVITQDAENAINRFAAVPFYLQVDYTTPHGDIVTPGGPEPAPRHAGTLAGVRAPRVPGYNERDISDKPRWVRANRRLGFGKIDYIDRRYQNRLEALRSVDEGVNRILTTLNAAGVLANTYVIFTSDNGFFQGEHRFDSAKFLPYEPSTHVPLLIRGPGIVPASRTGELAANVDVAPTVLQWAGARATRTLDGRSLVRFIADTEKRTKRPILLEGFTGKGEPGVSLRGGGRATASIRASPRDYEGIRVGRYKFIRYRSGARELYDLRRDRYEQHSRHRDPRYRKIGRWLQAHLRRLERCRARRCKKQLRGKIPRPLPKNNSKRRR